MRVVRVHDVGPDAPNHARQLPRGLEVQLMTGSERHEFEAFLRPLSQLAVRGVPPASRVRRARAGRGQSGGPGSARRARWLPCRCEGKTRPMARSGRARPDVRRLARRGGLRLGVLQLPELHELQQHVVRVQQRDDQAGRALPEPSPEDVVAGETRASGARRSAGSPPGGRSRTARGRRSSCSDRSCRDDRRLSA